MSKVIRNSGNIATKTKNKEMKIKKKIIIINCCQLPWRKKITERRGLTLERPKGGGSNGPPIGFSDLKFEAFKQSK